MEKPNPKVSIADAQSASLQKTLSWSFHQPSVISQLCREISRYARNDNLGYTVIADTTRLYQGFSEAQQSVAQQVSCIALFAEGRALRVRNTGCHFERSEKSPYPARRRRSLSPFGMTISPRQDSGKTRGVESWLKIQPGIM